MIEIHKITDKDIINKIANSDTTQEFVGIFDNNELLEYASYVINKIENEMVVTSFPANSNSIILADSLLKTLIFYADISKIRFIVFDFSCDYIVKKYIYEIKNNKYVIDLYNQNITSCSCNGKDA